MRGPVFYFLRVAVGLGRRRVRDELFGVEARREARELEAGEEVAGLAVELLLHLRVHLLALLHVGAHHALHGGALEVQELGPQVLA
jgi:hypothetical protein